MTDMNDNLRTVLLQGVSALPVARFIKGNLIDAIKSATNLEDLIAARPILGQLSGLPGVQVTTEVNTQINNAVNTINIENANNGNSVTISISDTAQIQATLGTGSVPGGYGNVLTALSNLYNNLASTISLMGNGASLPNIGSGDIITGLLNAYNEIASIKDRIGTLDIPGGADNIIDFITADAQHLADNVTAVGTALTTLSTQVGGFEVAAAANFTAVNNQMTALASLLNITNGTVDLSFLTTISDLQDTQGNGTIPNNQPDIISSLNDLSQAIHDVNSTLVGFEDNTLPIVINNYIGNYNTSTVQPGFLALQTQVNTQVFDASQIGNLDTSKITTGNFDASRINPGITNDQVVGLDASKLSWVGSTVPGSNVDLTSVTSILPSSKIGIITAPQAVDASAVNWYNAGSNIVPGSQVDLTSYKGENTLDASVIKWEAAGVSVVPGSLLDFTTAKVANTLDASVIKWSAAGDSIVPGSLLDLTSYKGENTLDASVIKWEAAGDSIVPGSLINLTSYKGENTLDASVIKWEAAGDSIVPGSLLDLTSYKGENTLDASVIKWSAAGDSVIPGSLLDLTTAKVENTLDASVINWGNAGDTTVPAAQVNGVLAVGNIPDISANYATKTNLDALQNQVNNLDNAVLDGQVSALQTNLATLQTQVNNLDNAVLDGQVSALQTNLATLQTQVNNLDNAVLDREVSALQTNLATLQTQVNNLDNAVLDGQVSTLQTNLATLQTQVNNLDNAVLDGQVSTLQTNLATLQTQVNTQVFDASKITTGNFDASRINNGITSDQVVSLDSTKINGVLNLSSIPIMDASHIPDMSARYATQDNLSALQNQVNTQVFDASQIGLLDSSKINTGSLDVDRIPDLSFKYVPKDSISGLVPINLIPGTIPNTTFVNYAGLDNNFKIAVSAVPDLPTNALSNYAALYGGYILSQVVPDLSSKYIPKDNVTGLVPLSLIPGNIPNTTLAYYAGLDDNFQIALSAIPTIPANVLTNYASLDASGFVPVSSIPNLPNYILTNYAALSAQGKVDASVIPDVSNSTFTRYAGLDDQYQIAQSAVPDIDAGVLTHYASLDASGLISQAVIPDLPGNFFTNYASVDSNGFVSTSVIPDVSNTTFSRYAGLDDNGEISLNVIPDLDAVMITSGVFDASQIPRLDASIINNYGSRFNINQIPLIDASFIRGDGTKLNTTIIPNMDASTIQGGTGNTLPASAMPVIYSSGSAQTVYANPGFASVVTAQDGSTFGIAAIISHCSKYIYTHTGIMNFCTGTDIGTCVDMSNNDLSATCIGLAMGSLSDHLV